MMADDFYNQTEETVETPQGDAPETEVEKIKLGEAEYTQDELNVLVEKGKFAKEIEEKQNIKLDKVWPGHQELSNKVKDYERQIEDLKQAKVATKVQEGVELTEAETIAQAKAEAKRLGIVTVDDVDAYLERKLEAREIRQDTLAVVEEFESKYGIKTSEEAILTHMVDTGIRNPEKAAKDLYEDKIDAYKEQKLNSLKKPGMVTDTTSSAGSKQPRAEAITNDNLFSKIDEVLDRAA